MILPENRWSEEKANDSTPVSDSPEPETGVDDASESVFNMNLAEIEQAHIAKKEAADEAAKAAAYEEMCEYERINTKPVLFRSSANPNHGEASWVEGGVSTHIKWEFEFSSQLAQKGLDPYTPHIEVDLTYTDPQLSVQEIHLNSPAVVLGYSEMEATNMAANRVRILTSAANVANSIALAALASLIESDKMRQNRAANEKGA